MIRTAAPSTRVVVLNACFSITVAEALRDVVDCVVGMRGGRPATTQRAHSQSASTVLLAITSPSATRWSKRSRHWPPSSLLTKTYLSAAPATVCARTRSSCHVLPHKTRERPSPVGMSSPPKHYADGPCPKQAAVPIRCSTHILVSSPSKHLSTVETGYAQSSMQLLPVVITGIVVLGTRVLEHRNMFRIRFLLGDRPPGIHSKRNTVARST